MRDFEKDVTYDENGDIVEVKEYRKGWCYQSTDTFELTGINQFSYVR
jgi:hypothetical protein